MRSDYFDRLDRNARSLVIEIEERLQSEVEIRIIPSNDDETSLKCCPFEPGTPIVVSDPEHFPSDAVYHELLHIRRYRVDQIPHIKMNENVTHLSSDEHQRTANALGALDHDIEHFKIVPEEIKKYPGRMNYWADSIKKRLDHIENSDSELTRHEQECHVLTLWAFLRYIHASGRTVKAAFSVAERMGLQNRTYSFFRKVKQSLDDKEGLVKFLINELKWPEEYVAFA